MSACGMTTIDQFTGKTAVCSNQAGHVGSHFDRVSGLYWYSVAAATDPHAAELATLRAEVERNRADLVGMTEAINEVAEECDRLRSEREVMVGDLAEQLPMRDADAFTIRNLQTALAASEAEVDRLRYRNESLSTQINEIREVSECPDDDGLTGHVEAMRDEIAYVRPTLAVLAKALVKLTTCAVCDASLHVDGPPHCLDCNLGDIDTWRSEPDWLTEALALAAKGGGT